MILINRITLLFSKLHFIYGGTIENRQYPLVIIENLKGLRGSCKTFLEMVKEIQLWYPAAEMSNDKNDLTYTNDAGEEVFTFKYHLNRGSCCKNGCLHCPYGFTLKKYSIEPMPIEQKHIKYANEIIKDSRPVELSNLASSILAGGFGKKVKIGVHHITHDNLNDFAFGTFKGVICAVIEFSNKLSESTSGRGVKELFLKKEFQNQGLGIEHFNNSK